MLAFLGFFKVPGFGRIHMRYGLGILVSPAAQAYRLPMTNPNPSNASMKTILITGCSSGFGLETARHFLERGWQVVATMRTPRNDVLPPHERLRVLALDVTDARSIREAVAAASAAGPIDVLVNNAGFGVASPGEFTPLATVREVFETNTFGTIAMTQAVLPQFRERGAGVVVNVTSSVTLKALPLIAAYRASKAAVNAFTESVALELEPFGVRLRLVLPGRSPETRFGDNARPHMHGFDHEAYAGLVKAVMAQMGDTSAPTTHAQDVALAVWRAATDPACPMRIPAGADAEAWAAEAG
jgi:NAD(P)-dependent dehydrogenase (short-subunit alcohol dehydrogenase family)